MRLGGEFTTKLCSVVSHPFHDEAVKWMGHPAISKLGEIVTRLDALQDKVQSNHRELMAKMDCVTDVMHTRMSFGD